MTAALRPLPAISYPLLRPIPSLSPTTTSTFPRSDSARRRVTLVSCLRAEEGESEAKGKTEAVSLVTAVRSAYNEIVVVDTPDSRLLLLDSTHNVHSILNKGKKLTGSYWDDFATLPAIIPEGPIAILGLGAGTAANIMLDIWPSLHLEGWEIDDILVHKAREYFGLSKLENPTDAGGVLSVNIGDALSPAAQIPGGFAGIVVDLFFDGKVLPELQETSTWSDIEGKLMPNGRIMVNCGGAHSEAYNDDGVFDAKFLPGHNWVQNPTIKTLCKSFPGKLSWRRLSGEDSENYLALTGPLPDYESWSAAVPTELAQNVKQWKPCELA